VALPPVAPLLAAADQAAGAAYAKNACGACHSFNDGGKAGIGPNLYGVVGGPFNHMQGFNYSNTLKAKQGTWSFDALNQWLYKPAAFAPGTRMTFAGINDSRQRANVILYLRSLSASPIPLPDPSAAPIALSEAKSPSSSDDEETTIAELLATADAKRGQAATLRYACVACHTFVEGGKAGIGPNLYGVVNGPHAHMPGFAYSPVLRSKEGLWTYAELNKWLKNPAAYAPGTKMLLAGVPDPKDRADLIAYLRTLSANPEPLPAK
jgi:cytochrome c